MVDAQVAKDVTLGHRDVQTQDLQHVLNRLRAVLVQLKTHNQNKHHQFSLHVQKNHTFAEENQGFPSTELLSVGLMWFRCGQMKHQQQQQESDSHL